MTAQRPVAVGDRFGELTVEEELDRDQYGVRWLCRCDCGKTAIRRTASLNAAVRNGQTSMCRACLNEYRAGLWIALRQDHRTAMRRLWDEKGTLYSNALLNRMQSDIRQAVEDEQGPFVEPLDTPVEAVPWEPPDDAPADRTMTYDEIGAVIHCSRERVRQIILIALGRLRRPVAEMLAVRNPKTGKPVQTPPTRPPSPVYDAALIDAAIARAKAHANVPVVRQGSVKPDLSVWPKAKPIVVAAAPLTVPDDDDLDDDDLDDDPQVVRPSVPVVQPDPPAPKPPPTPEQTAVSDARLSSEGVRQVFRLWSALCTPSEIADEVGVPKAIVDHLIATRHLRPEWGHHGR